MIRILLLDRFILIAAHCILLACSLYIEDFQVGGDGSVADQENADNTDRPNTGDEPLSEGIIRCGIQVTSPAGTALEFCAIETGTFSMGCDSGADTCMDDELPIHDVQISAYRIQRYEVTTAAYRAFVGAMPEWGKGGAEATNKCDAGYLKIWNDNTPPAGSLNQPVLGVCWYAAATFCDWIAAGYRLPTEAEWERAARGASDGTDSSEYRVYPFGDDPTCSVANYNSCGSEPVDVGSRTGTSFGKIFDMGGNAWEWVSDWYGEHYYCDPLDEGVYDLSACKSGFEWKDPQGPEVGAQKILRGGSWFHDVDMLRSAKREHMDPAFSSNIIGFRCASDS